MPKKNRQDLDSFLYKNSPLPISSPPCNKVIIDYKNGEEVCMDPGREGEVIGRIIYWGPPREDEKEEEWRRIRIKNLKKRKRRNKNPENYRTTRYYKLYKIAKQYIQDKPWLEVDYNKLFENGKMINTMKHKSTIEAERNTEKLGLKNILDEIVNTILLKSKYAYLFARSERGKLALAYIIGYYSIHKAMPPDEDIIQIFCVSETSYRRYRQLVLKSGIFRRQSNFRKSKT